MRNSETMAAGRQTEWGVHLVRGLLALLFVAVGVAKLGASPELEAMFAEWGYPLWFSWVVGLAEISGAILLLIRRWRPYGAALLIVVMLGAIATHVLNAQWSMIAAPLAILLAVAAVGSLTRLRK